MQPCIVLHDCQDGVLRPSSVTISLDGVDVIIGDDLDITLAFPCLMACYFVYGIQYPRKLRNTLIFLERFLFALPSAEKVPYMVQRAANMLCSK